MYGGCYRLEEGGSDIHVHRWVAGVSDKVLLARGRGLTVAPSESRQNKYLLPPAAAARPRPLTNRDCVTAA